MQVCVAQWTIDVKLQLSKIRDISAKVGDNWKAKR